MIGLIVYMLRNTQKIQPIQLDSRKMKTFSTSIFKNIIDSDENVRIFYV